MWLPTSWSWTIDPWVESLIMLLVLNTLLILNSIKTSVFFTFHSNLKDLKVYEDAKCRICTVYLVYFHLIYFLQKSKHLRNAQIQTLPHSAFSHDAPLKSRIEQFVEAINLRSLYIQFFRSSNGPSNPIFATFGQPLNPKVSASFAKSRAGDSGQTQLIWWSKLRFQLSIWLCASRFQELTCSPPMRWSPMSERSGPPVQVKIEILRPRTSWWEGG